MGIRPGLTVATLLLFAATACGVHTHVEPSPPPAPTMGPTPVSQPFAELNETARRAVTRFVTTALSYDTRRETATAFLTRVQDLVTTAEGDRLHGSGRASLNWAAMRARRERSSIEVTGITATGTSGWNVACVVNAIRRTTSTIAATRDFVTIRLTLVWTANGWRVSDSEGSGL